MFPGTPRIFAIYTAFRVAFGNLGGNTSAVDYVDHTSRANYVFSDPLFNRSSQSLEACLAKCLVEDTCYGVTFNKDEGHCQGYARFAGPVFADGTRLWTKKIRCHASYIYDPNSDLCFKLFGGYDWAGAVDFCAEDDGRLLVLNTIEKLLFYKEYLRKSGDSGWRSLGGRRVAGVWTWIDGSPMNMSKQFWRLGEPSGSGTFMKATRSPTQDGLFNDGTNGKSRFVCEKP